MNKRYNFEIINNDPDLKCFHTKADAFNDDEMFVWIQHNHEELELILHSKMKIVLEDSGFFKRLRLKLKIIFDIIRNRKVEVENSFVFRGRNHIEDFADMISLLGKQVNQETNELIEARKKLRQLQR